MTRMPAARASRGLGEPRRDPARGRGPPDPRRGGGRGGPPGAARGWGRRGGVRVNGEGVADEMRRLVIADVREGVIALQVGKKAHHHIRMG